MRSGTVYVLVCSARGEGASLYLAGSGYQYAYLRWSLNDVTSTMLRLVELRRVIESLRRPRKRAGYQYAQWSLVTLSLASLLTSRYVTQGESVIGNPLVGAVHFYEVLRPRWAYLQCERDLAERSGAEASEASIPVVSTRRPSYPAGKRQPCIQ